MSKTRVRFAPSPTGGLHLGGVRTALYNYLFAKQHGGDFILRIEDTDQTRFVNGAEEYINECLNWCGLQPDESAASGGDYAPYRQSERKNIYRNYAEQLVKNGYAYYAFDTPEEIERMRENLKKNDEGNLQYDHHTRMQMNNSLTLDPQKTEKLIEDGKPYVIRIKIKPNELIFASDMIRREIKYDTNNIDDKVLLKADGMPTYHLAVVVDDYLMKISHVFRGEEWMASLPVHILLWKYLGWENQMPQWAHLPLILKPDGNGKLSKRDGDRLGFPVFAINWTDPKTNEVIKGFKELGFLHEAFINFLAVLGWNDGTAQEIYSIDELIEKFSIEKVHHAGAKFDYEKAKWFNHEWIRRLPVSHYQLLVKSIYKEKGIEINDNTKFEKVLTLIKDRCVLLTDFFQQGSFFFKMPDTIDITAIQPTWNAKKQMFFVELIRAFELSTLWNTTDLEKEFKELASANQLKPGELMSPFRIMLVGGKFGPGVFEIASILGRDETIQRIRHTIQLFDKAV